MCGKNAQGTCKIIGKQVLESSIPYCNKMGEETKFYIISRWEWEIKEI
jgi:hypothetical protein